MSPPLGLCSPAKSLGLRVCHSFCAYIRQSLSSLQRPEPEKRLFRQLPFSSATSELPQQERLLSRSSTLHALVFPFASRRYRPFRYTPFPQPHQQPTLAVGITPHNPFHKHRSTNRKFFLPNPTLTKTCAKPLCILQRSQVVQSLSISCFPPHSNSQSARALQSLPVPYRSFHLPHTQEADFNLL